MAVKVVETGKNVQSEIGKESDESELSIIDAKGYNGCLFLHSEHKTFNHEMSRKKHQYSCCSFAETICISANID